MNVHHFIGFLYGIAIALVGTMLWYHFEHTVSVYGGIAVLVLVGLAVYLTIDE